VRDDGNKWAQTRFPHQMSEIGAVGMKQQRQRGKKTIISKLHVAVGPAARAVRSSTGVGQR